MLGKFSTLTRFEEPKSLLPYQKNLAEYITSDFPPDEF